MGQQAAKSDLLTLTDLFTIAQRLCDNLPKKNPEIWQECRQAVLQQTHWDDELRGILQVHPAAGAIHAWERSQDRAVCSDDDLSLIQYDDSRQTLEGTAYGLPLDTYQRYLHVEYPRQTTYAISPDMCEASACDDGPDLYDEELELWAEKFSKEPEQKPDAPEQPGETPGKGKRLSWLWSWLWRLYETAIKAACEAILKNK